MTNVKNNSESSIRIGATNLRAGATAKVDRWDIHQHNDHVRSLLDAKAIEVVEDEQPEPEKAERKPKAKKEASDGVYLTDGGDV